MKSSRTSRLAKVVAPTSSIALLAAGCSSGASKDAAQPASADNPVTLTVTTFGTQGLDPLYKQYEKENPGVTIEATNIDTGGNALTDWKTKQAAGAGLPDAQAVEEGWLGQVMTVSGSFTDLNEYGASDPLALYIHDCVDRLPVADAGRPQTPTLQVALGQLQSARYVDYTIVMTGALMATIPLLLLFVVAGKQLVSGIMAGAVKG